MKKILAFILSAVLCLSFAACGGEAEETTAAETTAAETTVETVAETTAETTVETAAETIAETAQAPTVTMPYAEAADLATAAKDIEDLLAALKAGDKDTIVALSGSDAPLTDELLLQMLVGMFSKLEYTVGAPTDNGDGTASIPVEISAISITSVFTEYMVEAAKHIDDESWDLDGSYFVELCSSDKVATETKNVTVNFENADGKWIRSADNVEFINTLFGGLIG